MPSTPSRTDQAAQHQPARADLADYYARHLERLPISDHTARAYEGAVRRFADWLETYRAFDYLDVVSNADVAASATRDYRRHLLVDLKRSPKTADAAVTAIGGMFQWLGLPRPKMPTAADPDLDDAPRSLTDEQVVALLRAARRHSVRDHAMIALLYGAAPRVSEVVALDVDDVALADARGIVEVRYGKGGKPRRIEIGRVTVEPMRAWLRVRAEEHGLPMHTGPLFVARGSHRNQRLSARSVRHVVATLALAAGIEEPVSPHMLRHTALTVMARDDVDVSTLAKIAGHSSVRTTQRYTKPRRPDLQAAIDRLDVDY